MDRKALVLALARVPGRNHAGLKQELYREDTHVYSQNREQTIPVIVALDEAMERGSGFTLAQGVSMVREELIAEAGPELTAKLQAARARDVRVEETWSRVLALVEIK